ncbi:MAG: PQQ-binding-like beta-propeller repeat protein [Planctomycetia bacterium]|nr:PQQ-binding-like beta-propeller repeat protein [Planctomycetia bacterium]
MKARAVVLTIGILALLGIGGYVAYKSHWVRSWFMRDSENTAEVQKLSERKLKLPPVADASAGWPQWRGPLRDGRPAAGEFRTDWDKTPPKELWKHPVGGGFGSLAVVGGRLYVQDKQGSNERVLCLDAETGKQMWEYSYASAQAGNDGNLATGPRATPTVEGKMVYTVGGAGKLLALEAEETTVKVRWQKDLLQEFSAPMPQWGVACSPLILGDMLIVQPGGPNASVVAFDKNTGDVKWKTASNPPGYSSPVSANIEGIDTVFAFTGDALLAIRASDGKVTGSYDWKTDHNGNITTPLVVEEYIYISSAYGGGCALLRAEKSGDEVNLIEVRARRGRAFQNHHATSVFKDDYLFGIDGQTGGHGLKCIDFKTLQEKPGWDGREIGQGTIILAGDHLIIQTARGELCLVEANTAEFNLVAKIPKVLSGRNNWATPALTNGRLYMRDDEKVVCLDVR